MYNVIYSKDLCAGFITDTKTLSKTQKVYLTSGFWCFVLKDSSGVQTKGLNTLKTIRPK